MIKRIIGSAVAVSFIMSVILSVTPVVMAEDNPVIFNISCDISPGEVFNAYGADIDAVNEIELINADSSESYFVKKINGDNDYLTAILPSSAPAGLYYIRINGKDSKTVLNAPKPKWISNRKAYAGQVISVFGQGLLPPEYGVQSAASVKLSDGKRTIYPEITAANPYEIKFRVPEGAVGGIYDVYVSCGNDLWFTPEYTEDNNRLEIMPDVVRTVSADETANIEIKTPAGNSYTVWDTESKGNYLYVQAASPDDSGRSGLRVYDISNMQSPADVTPDNDDMYFSTAVAAVGALHIEGDYLYCLTWDNPAYLLQYSIKNPAAPVLAGKHKLNSVSTPRDMVLYGSRAYIAACGGIVSVELEDAYSESTWKTGYDANLLSIDIENDVLFYTAFNDNGVSYLYVSRINGDGSVSNIGRRGFDNIERIADVCVNDGYAYLGLRNENASPQINKLVSVEVGSADNEAALNNAAVNQTDLSYRISEIGEYRGYICVSSLDGRFVVYDGTEGLNPIEKCVVNNWRPNWCAGIGDGFAFMGNADSGVNVIRINIAEKKAEDPLGLGVYWAAEFNWDNTVNVDIADKKNTDVTDYIRNAVNDAYNAGGGVVLIPEGEFIIRDIEMKNGVVLRGAGHDKTVLRYNHSEWAVIRNSSSPEGLGGLQGICDLKVTLDLGDDAPYYPDYIFYFGSFGNAGMSKVFVKNCDTDMPMFRRWNGEYAEESGNMPGQAPKLSDDGRGIAFYTDVRSDVLIDSCNFKGFIGSPYIISSSSGGTKYITMRNCTMRMNTGNAHLLGSYVVAENNSIIIEKELENPYDFNSEGIITRAPSYIANNYIEGAGKTGHNDGEAILTENAGGGGTKLAGVVTASTSNSVTVNPERNNNSWDLSYHAWYPLNIVITKGKGMGQYRSISRADESTGTIYVSKPWDIQPDSTSRFAVIQPVKGAIVYNNRIKDCSKGLWFYNNSIDCVMAENICENSSGLFVNSCDLGPGNEQTVSYFNKMVNNTVSGFSDKVHSSAIGETVILWVDTDAYAVNSYGSEIRGNLYDGSGYNKNHISGIIESGDITGIYLGHSDRLNENDKLSDLSSPVVKAGIISENTVRNSERGISIGGNAYPDTWFHKYSYRTRGTTGIALRNNITDNTEIPYCYNYKDGKMPLDDVYEASGHIKASLDMTMTDKAENGTVDFSAEISNVDFISDDFKLIIAVYDDSGHLIKAAVGSDVKIEKGGQSIIRASADLSDVNIKNVKIKGFVWNNNMNPALINPYSC
ncbi:MAG: hypothetical protein J6N52_04025 [Clostridia bacterium]|nr:hypothetical protein [Clostridia bacterium]